MHVCSCSCVSHPLVRGYDDTCRPVLMGHRPSCVPVAKQLPAVTQTLRPSASYSVLVYLSTVGCGH
eukprot:3117841-Prymnesium_polylepis.1